MGEYNARKLDDKVWSKILGALSVGATRTDAARIGGIRPETLYLWIEHGESARANTRLGRFYQAVVETESGAKIAAMNTIMEAIRGDPEHDIPGNPRIALDFLRRRYPDEWGGAERIQIDAVHHIAGPKQDTPDSLSDLGLNDDQIRVLGTQLARLESGQVPVPALTVKHEDAEEWADGEEGVDWEWEYVVEDDQEGE